MKLTQSLTLLTLPLFASGCLGTVATVKVIAPCPTWLLPLSFTESDSDSTVVEIAKHNAKYERFCGGDAETHVQADSSGQRAQ